MTDPHAHHHHGPADATPHGEAHTHDHNMAHAGHGTPAVTDPRSEDSGHVGEAHGSGHMDQ